MTHTRTDTRQKLAVWPHPLCFLLGFWGIFTYHFRLSSKLRPHKGIRIESSDLRPRLTSTRMILTHHHNLSQPITTNTCLYGWMNCRCWWTKVTTGILGGAKKERSHLTVFRWSWCFLAGLHTKSDWITSWFLENISSYLLTTPCIPVTPTICPSSEFRHSSPYGLAVAKLLGQDKLWVPTGIQGVVKRYDDLFTRNQPVIQSDLL